MPRLATQDSPADEAAAHDHRDASPPLHGVVPSKTGSQCLFTDVTSEMKELLKFAESLPTRYKYITRETVASACAVGEDVSRELLKHLVQQALVNEKPTRGKGHE